jgi:FKBP-type peptidyl-prolyl cis-trans isomerase FkpA
MKLKTSIILSVLAFTLLLYGCDGYKSEDGVKYKIIVDSAGPTVEPGGAVFVYMTYVNEKDTFDTRDRTGGMPYPLEIPDSTGKYNLERGLRMLSAGDSATFIISTDSALYKRIPPERRPKDVKEGSMTTFNVRIVSVISKDSVGKIKQKMQQEMLAREMQRQLQGQLQAQLDSAEIVKYIKANRLNPKRTPDGVYYVVKSPVATGFNIQPGDSVKAFYTGKLLNGTTFDSNVGKEPFTLVAGMGQVIKGWDSGLMALKKGEKAILIIPSHLGYGAQGAGQQIPPNSILIFEVEVLK